MKKGLKMFLLLLMILAIGLTTIGCNDKPTLNIYNYGDYIAPEVIKDFEEEFNVKVNYNTFATNEDMYVSIKKGGTSYDLVFPSDYMVERMIEEGLLAEINKENIPNMQYIGEEFLGLEFDPENKYSVPYMWGTLGIIYNKTMVDDVVDSWDILWNEKYAGQILMLDSQRDSIGVALKKLGYSMNTRDLNELEEAKNELIKQKPLVYAYVGDDVRQLMVAEEAALAVVWSGDAIPMVTWENENLEYVYPKEGTNIWFDCMVIPKNAKNKELAEEFINYLNRPEVALKNIEYLEYATVNVAAQELLPEEIRNHPVAYPSKEILENTEIFRDVKDMLNVYDELWLEVKSHR
ncbi:MAG: spermidine/putrescine ABC transporter substrate-binding protein [Tissierellia bacterium]|nr:spermidine/putrescine ABC transporter substrate-binding protein [Tissierellia bacterium]